MTIYECDGCGKRLTSPLSVKPQDWFEKSLYSEMNTEKQVLHACSRDCISIAAAKHSVDTLVLPL